MAQHMLLIVALQGVTAGAAAAASVASSSTNPTPAAAADEVSSLPGWESESGEPLALPSRHFSGYLPVGDGSDDRHLHYYHIEAETTAEQAPLLLWLNGGPGSSSLFGMFTEVGQLVFNRDSLRTNSTEAPRLFRNPESWSTKANMLFLESPVGVGWSYCAASARDGKPCVCNDTTTANENYDALLAFTARFPAFKERPFFISGESYAGIYIPTLAEVIMSKGGINLQGMAIGNGCVRCHLICF
jgi:cathepsin A (carboxypeptidase C)